ncbi:MAG: ATP synthase archaeal subunit H [Methanobacterium sp. ERen5]|nr:MAG: ATP synthase archaeal subunit H [Methanobacterium sp. ERen5]
MTTISEAITTIKTAENDADKLIEDTKELKSERIEEARLKSKEIIAKSKEEASAEAENMAVEAETKAKKEALHISNTTSEEVRVTKSTAMNKVDEAADLIVKSIL